MFDHGSTPPPPAPAGGLARARRSLGEAAAHAAHAAGVDVAPGAAADIGAEIAQTITALEQVKYALCQNLASFEKAGGLAGSGYGRLLDWITHTATMGRAEAATYARTAQLPEALDETTAAYQAGEISLGQVEHISFYTTKAVQERNRTEWPQEAPLARKAEEVLLGLALAESTTCADIATAGKRLRARLNPKTHERDYAQRYDMRGATFVRGPDSEFHLEAWGDEVSADQLQAALEAFGGPPQPGDTRRPRQRLFDQLLDMAEHTLRTSGQLPSSGGQPAQVRITVPLEALRGIPGAFPATSDYGTVYPLSAVRAAAKDCVLRRIVTDPLTGAPLDVGRAKRIFPVQARIALLSQVTSCQWEHGCDRPARWCQIDHKQPWWEGGTTDLANAQPLCRVHNLEKEHRRARKHHRRQQQTRQAGNLHHPPGPGSGGEPGGGKPPGTGIGDPPAPPGPDHPPG
ncbi:HNH endonuclease [Murinocardiopsis flavida]|uniref:HNH endonuclease n=1 Tax=Murinocardiopsis flavida TaxID=645275 RepID=A0A2P8DFG4_9ACTN|nr:HNH endonuclease signature motif containing protein [Murinocardiopsis flavida]PSK95940.1 HNH endonuclease [Murinocardiopsis flavida]